MTKCFKGRMKRERFVRGVWMGLVSVACAASAMTVSAQASNCGFDVSRDVVMNPSPRLAGVALDGLLLTRFALGMRGPLLYDKLSMDTTRFVAESNVGSLAGKFDIDGDGVYTQTDATIAARYITGFRNDALTRGLTFNSAATRTTGALVTQFIDGGCVQPLATTSLTKHAARLLQQGTYGATLDEINRVSTLVSTPGATPSADEMTKAWLTEQFNKMRSPFASYSQQILAENKTGNYSWRCTNTTNGCPWAVNTPAFYKRAMEGEDQLRQRATNALWQTLVVSINNNTVLDAGDALPSYWDMLSENIFAPNTTNAATIVSGQTVDPATGLGIGNFRKILRDMTLHPAMGVYLDMLGSTQEVPNENYARELLQLFSVGTVMLNLDGTPKLENGKTIPTYDEDAVKGFAKALSGWHYAGADGDTTKPWYFYYFENRNYTLPMQPWTMRRCPQDGRWPPNTTTGWCDLTRSDQSYPAPHSREEKKLLQYPGAPYATLAAKAQPALGVGQNHLTAAVREEVAATAREDLEKTIDNVFYHPNVGPFIVRQLIQRLVTSNPTQGYVARVAAVFNDSNGAAAGGTRGDMREVIKAIFLDSEARDVSVAAKPWFGKLREPVIKFVHMHRAFNARASGGYYDTWDTSDSDALGQGAMKPPSVFNYYSPDFRPTGAAAYPQLRPNAELGARSAEALYAPEFEITSTSTIAGFSNFWNWAVYGGFNPDDNNVARRWQPNYSRYITGTGALADTPAAMIDELDLLLTAGNLKPAFKANLAAMALGILRSNIDEQRDQRFRAVFWQIVHSADYAIQR